MKRRCMKKVFGVLGIFIMITCIYKCVISGHTMPIWGTNSISEYRTINLGSVEQSILIRGHDRSNPVLLYIHGGPGNPETAFITPYQSEWEKKFTVVNWDQRGSGRSYSKKINTETLTTAQICADALELTQYLRDAFDMEKIYIMGHSYGTYVGMKCVQIKPDYYYAYVGLGQIGNQQDNEKNLRAYAIKKASEDNNLEAISELEGLGNLPYNESEFGEKIAVSRKWTTYYGGAIYGAKDMNRLYADTVIRPEYSLFDLICFFKGEKLYYTNAEKNYARWELFNANLFEEIPKVNVPIYFIQGKNDYITSFAACEAYFNALDAPYKKLMPLDDCAHNPIVEKTDDVSNILINEVLE